MRNKLGYIFMICGAAMVLAAFTLFLYNREESRRAEKSVNKVLPELAEYLRERQNADPGTDRYLDIDYPDPYDPAMTEVEIDGYAYVGYLSLPSLGLELPVLSAWDDTRLKLAPCRYTGSTKTGNLVIAAHNYKRYFGKISHLSERDEVLFTDMDGVTTRYEVAEVEILQPFAVEEMTSGEYELTLFTCTYGGRSRVTVRCRRQ